MRHLLAVLLVALATAGGAAADTFTIVPSSPAAPTTSADTPNARGLVAVPLQLALSPAQPQRLSVSELQPIWQHAGEAYGIPWQVLAAINKIESDFGRNMGPSSAGAVGWMQFMPDTWARWGMDADGDGIADPWNATDAIYSAARYLAAAGGAEDLRRAVFAYNHADWYVDQVLSLAQTYAGGAVDTHAVELMQQRLDEAEQAVAEANQALVDARAPVADLRRELQDAERRVESEALLSDQLLAQKDVSDLQGRLLEAEAVVSQREEALASAEAELDAARAGSQAASFAPGTGALLAAPAYESGYVFPVGGGPAVVSVGPNHHDYPAADIAAPAGSPAYALADGVVLNAWREPDARCGIGFTFRSADGLTWTYCHLAYLEPAVADGAQLSAGAPVGLVGETGDAEGPHLHLQLEPATGYPQDEPWFEAFAGSAYSWRTDSQSNPAPGPIFMVVGQSQTEPAVVYFTA